MGKKSKRNPNKKRNDKAKKGDHPVFGQPSKDGRGIVFQWDPDKNCKRGLKVEVLMEPDGKFGHVYSFGNGNGKPEYFARNVPEHMTGFVAEMIEELSSKDMGHGERVRFEAGKSNSGNRIVLYMFLTLIGGQRKAGLTSQYPWKLADSKNPLLEVVPEFNHEGPLNHVEYWGRRALSPEGRTNLVESILDVWYDQWNFVLFLDRNMYNYDIANMKPIDLSVALRKVEDTSKVGDVLPNDWVVSWFKKLSPEQIKFVCKHSRYFSKITKVLFRKPKLCAHCGLVDSKKLVRCLCKNAWYCCQEHLESHWPQHKDECKVLRSKLDNNPILAFNDKNNQEEESDGEEEDDEEEKETTLLPSCAQCGIVAEEKFYLCSVCETIWYCGHECQAVDWPVHKRCCKTIKWHVKLLQQENKRF